MDSEIQGKGFFSATSKKSIQDFIESFRENAGQFGFGVRHVFSMKEEYKEHNVDVDDTFELYQIILCNFERSYETIKRNIETAAVLLQPKQVVVCDNKGITTVYYLPFTKEFITHALPDNERLQQGLPSTCHRIIKVIEVSL